MGTGRATDGCSKHSLSDTHRASRVLKTYFSAVGEHVLPDTRSAHQRLILGSPAASTVPDHSCLVLTGSLCVSQPPIISRSVAHIPQAAVRIQALPWARRGSGDLQHLELAGRCVYSVSSHGFTTTLLRSGDPITSTASAISVRGNLCEMIFSVSTKPVSISRIALDHSQRCRSEACVHTTFQEVRQSAVKLERFVDVVIPKIFQRVPLRRRSTISLTACMGPAASTTRSGPPGMIS